MGVGLKVQRWYHYLSLNLIQVRKCSICIRTRCGVQRLYSRCVGAAFVSHSNFGGLLLQCSYVSFELWQLPLLYPGAVGAAFVSLVCHAVLFSASCAFAVL